MGSHSLLHGIFPTQGSNLSLLYYKQILYCLSHQANHMYIYIHIVCNINWYFICNQELLYFSSLGTPTVYLFHVYLKQFHTNVTLGAL